MPKPRIYTDEERKERKKNVNKKWRENNKEKEALRKKLYSQSEKGKRAIAIKNWKAKGVICENYAEMYERYINTNNCEYCDLAFKNSRDRHLDHNHSIQDKNNVRGILCRSCNLKDVLKNK